MREEMKGLYAALLVPNKCEGEVYEGSVFVFLAWKLCSGAII